VKLVFLDVFSTDTMKLLNFRKQPKTSFSEGSVYHIMWKKFLKSKLNLLFLIVLLVSVFIAIAGYLITPDKTQFANKQYLELTLQKPGTKVKMLKVEKNSLKTKRTLPVRMLFGKIESYESIPIFNWKIENNTVIAETYTGMAPNDGLMIKFHPVDVISALDTTYNVSYESGMYRWRTVEGKNEVMNLDEIFETIEKKHIIERRFRLGTDRFGRDVLSQLIIGARVSLSVGFVSVLISLIIGIFFGAISGYYGGWIDRLVMWIINVVWAIPSLFLVIAITFALGKGFWQIFFAVGLTLWVEVARLVRGLVMSIKNREYIEAARALGLSNSRIIRNHILPATLGPVIVVSAANFASAILIESGLSFLGIGIQPPMPSWGTMLRENYGFLIMDYAYLAIIPGIAIMLFVLTFMVLGNGLRDAMDVREMKL
jgi:peptide/nickel transport system permease protein